MPYEYHATVVGVHDGDTITVHIDLGFDILWRNQKIRLLGINAPELNTPDGIASRDALLSVIPVGTEIVMQTKQLKGDKEKYGRWLGTIMAPVDGVVSNINVWMVSNGHAKPFMIPLLGS